MFCGRLQKQTEKLGKLSIKPNINKREREREFKIGKSIAKPNHDIIGQKQ